MMMKGRNRFSATPGGSVASLTSVASSYQGSSGAANKKPKLHRAIEKNDVEEAMTIIRKGGDPALQERDPLGRTCVHVCATSGSFQMLLILLANDVDVNAVDNFNQTPLHCACLASKFEIVDRLLKLAVDVKAVDNKGRTPLHSLVEPKVPRDKKALFCKILKEMIAKGAAVNAQNKDGNCPLHVACMSANQTAVRPLLDLFGIDINCPNRFGETPLICAAKTGDKKIVKLLLDKDADYLIMSESGSASEAAALAHHQEIVTILYNHAAKKRKQSQRANNNRSRVTEEDTLKELQYYVEHGHYEDYIQLIEEHGITNQQLLTAVDSSGKTLLHIASYHGNVQMVKNLLDRGFNVNTQDKNGWNSLHFAACSDNENVVLMLLKIKDVNVNAANADKNTALHYIAKNQTFAKQMPVVIEALAAKGMNFNAVNINGETALHNCSWKGHISAARLLIERGANVNIKNSKNETALHWAARMGHAELLKLLIDNGADTSIRGEEGTPLEIAQTALEPNEKIILMLGGKPKKPDDDAAPEADKRSWFHKLIENKRDLKGSDVAGDIQFEMHRSFSWLIRENEVELGELLGSGRFGVVYKGAYRGQTVAVKNLTNVNGKYEIQKEFEIMSSMRSPRVVYFYGVVLLSPTTACMVMSYCAKGSLTNLLRDTTLALDWGLIFKWCRQITQGVNDLHCWVPQIIHRDLKSLNLLVDEYYNCVVSDFGISRFVVDDNLSTLSKLRGTYAYCAPEIYLGGPAGPKSDVFSLGIILWELMTRCIRGEYVRPYSEYKHLIIDFQIIIQVAKNKLRPTIHPDCPESFANLIRRCWDNNEDMRPDCKEIIRTLADLQKDFESSPSDWKTFKRAPGSERGSFDAIFSQSESEATNKDSKADSDNDSDPESEVDTQNNGNGGTRSRSGSNYQNIVHVSPSSSLNNPSHSSAFSSNIHKNSGSDTPNENSGTPKSAFSTPTHNNNNDKVSLRSSVKVQIINPDGNILTSTSESARPSTPVQQEQKESSDTLTGGVTPTASSFVPIGGGSSAFGTFTRSEKEESFQPSSPTISPNHPLSHSGGSGYSQNNANASSLKNSGGSTSGSTTQNNVNNVVTPPVALTATSAFEAVGATRDSRSSSMDSTDGEALAKGPATPPTSTPKSARKLRASSMDAAADTEEASDSSVETPRGTRKKTLAKKKSGTSMRSPKTERKGEMTWFEYVKTPEYIASVGGTPTMSKKKQP